MAAEEYSGGPGADLSAWVSKEPDAATVEPQAGGMSPAAKAALVREYGPRVVDQINSNLNPPSSLDTATITGEYL